MSAISDLYDYMVSMLDTTFPSSTYRKLVNPYIADLNDTMALNRGYGFYIGPKIVRPKLGNYDGFEVDIIVIQTIINRGTDRDVSIRESAEKTLLEDQYTLTNYFRSNTGNIDKVWDINYESDNGLEFVFSDKQAYVMIQTTLKGIYSESC